MSKSAFSEIQVGMSVTYYHPLSYKEVTDSVTAVSPCGTITVDRKGWHSSRNLRIKFSQVISFS
jgi:hypothetical protein